MKTKVIVILAAAAMLATGCRDIRRQVNDLLAYPTTAEEVAAAAKDYHSDAALVVTKADTQYVLYRRSSAYSNRDGIQRCYAMRYVSQHRCRHDFSSRGGDFRLDLPPDMRPALDLDKVDDTCRLDKQVDLHAFLFAALSPQQKRRGGFYRDAVQMEIGHEGHRVVGDQVLELKSLVDVPAGQA